MRIMKLIIIFVLLPIIIFGCNNDTPTESAKNTRTGQTIVINETQFTLEQINMQIQEKINNDVYYSGYSTESDNIFLNRDLFLNQLLEYKLYYVPAQADPLQLLIDPAEIQIVITNLVHPLSATKGQRYLYQIAFNINETGLQSNCMYRNISAEAEPDGVFLGNFSMYFSELTKPQHEVMSDDWKERARAALALYMDRNDFSAIDNYNLPAGNYCVYIAGFSEADTDATVIFKHEDGSIYQGTYYFIHDISGDHPADLNRVTLVGDADAMEEYITRLQDNAALSMEYKIRDGSVS